MPSSPFRLVLCAISGCILLVLLATIICRKVSINPIHCCCWIPTASVQVHNAPAVSEQSQLPTEDGKDAAVGSSSLAEQGNKIRNNNWTEGNKRRDSELITALKEDQLKSFQIVMSHCIISSNKTAATNTITVTEVKYHRQYDSYYIHCKLIRGLPYCTIEKFCFLRWKEW